MTPRTFSGYALIAGIGYTEALDLMPGVILDMFMMKHKYDIAHQGISRR